MRSGRAPCLTQAAQVICPSVNRKMSNSSSDEVMTRPKAVIYAIQYSRLKKKKKGGGGGERSR